MLHTKKKSGLCQRKSVFIHFFKRRCLVCLILGPDFKKKFLNRREGPEVRLDFADSGFVLIKCPK